MRLAQCNVVTPPEVSAPHLRRKKRRDECAAGKKFLESARIHITRPEYNIKRVRSRGAAAARQRSFKEWDERGGEEQADGNGEDPGERGGGGGGLEKKTRAKKTKKTPWWAFEANAASRAVGRWRRMALPSRSPLSLFLSWERESKTERILRSFGIVPSLSRQRRRRKKIRREGERASVSKRERERKEEDSERVPGWERISPPSGPRSLSLRLSLSLKLTAYQSLGSRRHSHERQQQQQLLFLSLSLSLRQLTISRLFSKAGVSDKKYREMWERFLSDFTSRVYMYIYATAGLLRRSQIAAGRKRKFNKFE